jgi:hypothetical protein
LTPTQGYLSGRIAELKLAKLDCGSHLVIVDINIALRDCDAAVPCYFLQDPYADTFRCQGRYQAPAATMATGPGDAA